MHACAAVERRAAALTCRAAAQEVAERVVTHLRCVGDQPDVRKVADSLSTIAFAESGGRSVLLNPQQYGLRGSHGKR
jgi:hypothetical protein